MILQREESRFLEAQATRGYTVLSLGLFALPRPVAFPRSTKMKSKYVAASVAVMVAAPVAAFMPTISSAHIMSPRIR